ncbi:MAG: DUF3592 domain-containing protein [Lachnospiraceae bacterium]|nr:DUF3592 domain-containing protein [Lachnospiraceae bacterium]
MKTGDKLIVFFAGVIFLIVGIVLINKSNGWKEEEKDFNKNAREVAVYVNEVKSYRKWHRNKKRSSEIKYKAYVTYEIDGKTYSNIEIPDNAGAEYLTEGTNVMLYYHKDKPTWLRVEKEDNGDGSNVPKVLGYVFGGCGLLIMYLAFFGKTGY